MTTDHEVLDTHIHATTEVIDRVRLRGTDQHGNPAFDVIQSHRQGDAMTLSQPDLPLPPMPDLEPVPEFQTGELLSFSVRPRRTGVIFAVPLATTVEMAVQLREQLQERFPHVTIAVAPGSSSIAFEWEEPEE
jgi:hypothetical protein